MKRKSAFISPTIMLTLLIFAIKFDSNGIEWFWTGNEMITLILGISAIIFGISWFLDSRRVE